MVRKASISGDSHGALTPTGFPLPSGDSVHDPLAAELGQMTRRASSRRSGRLAASPRWLDRWVPRQPEPLDARKPVCEHHERFRPVPLPRALPAGRSHLNVPAGAGRREVQSLDTPDQHPTHTDGGIEPAIVQLTDRCSRALRQTSSGSSAMA
jgi:hypothetical protein